MVAAQSETGGEATEARPVCGSAWSETDNHPGRSGISLSAASAAISGFFFLWNIRL
ncbi:hypothetical protein [Desmospora activa]|uniref:hypothetical protein n=1 Tax=Desmospora activa TaxID=500615 RepID=UPI00147398CD|nr:hypothetical protein [Desmospora activa]